MSEASTRAVTTFQRPHVHFTPHQYWMNDPNGLIWLEGEYHLFFQHNPHGNEWGHMSWGHAVSRDLLSWTELPVAIWHDDLEGVFSGSVVYDAQNTSGLGSMAQPALIAIYTSALVEEPQLQRQSIAYSTDRGRTWTKYEGNPVLDEGLRDFRDPLVRWDPRQERWVMVLARSSEQRIGIYSSADLLTWRHESDFGPAGAIDGAWECPDLFELPLVDDPSKTRWILIVSLNPGGPHGGSGTQYFIGDFDGQRFVPDSFDAQWADFGTENYAGVTFNDEPEGRRILIGWMNTWQSARRPVVTPWNGMMTLPRELHLARDSRGLRLSMTPVAEVEARRGEAIMPDVLDSDGGFSWQVAHAAYDLKLDLAVNEQTELCVEVEGEDQVSVRYCVRSGRMHVSRAGSGIVPEEFEVFLTEEPSDSRSIRVIFDHGSIEWFVDSKAVTIGIPTALERLTITGSSVVGIGAAHLYPLS